MKLLILWSLALATIALARDGGQWAETDPTIEQWYQQLMRPDYPTMSCCGETDAYWADNFTADGDCNYVAIITDDRTVPGRAPRSSGTHVKVPRGKIK